MLEGTVAAKMGEPYLLKQGQEARTKKKKPRVDKVTPLGSFVVAEVKFAYL